MTLNELRKSGDEGRLQGRPKEARHWTNIYDNVPDGTKGAYSPHPRRHHVLRPHPRRPRTFWRLSHEGRHNHPLLPDGRLIPGNYSVTMTDQVGERRRDGLDVTNAACSRKRTSVSATCPRLPSGKRTRCSHCRHDGDVELVVKGISYHQLHERNEDGSPCNA